MTFMPKPCAEKKMATSGDNKWLCRCL